MDEELILQLIQEAMAGGGISEPVPEPDPRAQAQARFLSRLAQQDVTSPSRFTRREGRSGFSRATDFTSFADLGDILNAVEERDPLKTGGAVLLALLGAGGATALGRRLFKGAGAVDEVADVRRGAPDRRAVPREGPGGRRAGDVESEEIMGEVERLVAGDLLGQARRAAQAPAASTVDPLAELIRIIEQGGGR